ncbi:MAG: hypothetical protein JG767_1624 [Deferribacteraceae bacterium]|nr:hypothetical protein [Deferribacteraceae bacterium]
MSEIVKFLKCPDENEKGYEELFKKFIYFAKNYSIDEELLSMYHDFLSNKIFSNKSMIKFIHNNDDVAILKYLNTSINNFLKDYYNHFKNNDNLSLNSVVNDEDDLEFLDTIESDSISEELKFESYEILNIIVEKFDERKKRILCQYLYSNKKNFIKDLSRNAYDKAIQRLKVEIQDIVREHLLSQEAFLCFMQIYVSEVCEKFCCIDRSSK